MITLKRIQSDGTEKVLKSSTMVVLNSLKIFLNKGSKRSSTAMILKMFLNDDAKKLSQRWYLKDYKIYSFHLSSFKVSKKC